MKSFFAGLLSGFVLLAPAQARDSDPAAADSGVLVSSSGRQPAADGTSDRASAILDGSNQNGQDSEPQASAPAPTTAGEALESSSETVVVKAVDAVIFQMTSNLKLTQEQISAARPVVMDNIVKTRKLQQSLREGRLDSKTMVDQRQDLMREEDSLLASILSPGQLKAWVILQQEYDN